MKQIMIDSNIMSTLILILKKKSNRFLQYEMEEKKMIDVHAVNQKKTKQKKKKVHRFL